MNKTLTNGLKATALVALTLSFAPLARQAAPVLSAVGFTAPSHVDALILRVRQGRGADAGASHDAGDDKSGNRGGKGRGADDKSGKAKGDDKGSHKGGKSRGRDDGPNHT